MNGATALGTFAQLPLSEAMRTHLPEILNRLKAEYPIWRGKKFAWQPSEPLPDLVQAEGREVEGNRYLILHNASQAPKTVSAEGRTVQLKGFDYEITML